jgi:hypothetical protein
MGKNAMDLRVAVGTVWLGVQGLVVMLRSHAFATRSRYAVWLCVSIGPGLTSFGCAGRFAQQAPEGYDGPGKGVSTGTPQIATCERTRWCTPDGCDSDELAARRTFMKDAACPLERVRAATHAPVLPPAPPDVAADPERMRVWTRTHDEQFAGHTFLDVTGCGAETAYDCTKPPGTRAIPVCAKTCAAAASAVTPVPPTSAP